MNNILVFCEVTEEQHIAEVSLELCSKARKLADGRIFLENNLAVAVSKNFQGIANPDP